uniref:Uncharacterized protein n=1 Tax=Arundo donax TaxID=35708 RepID=A0A0A9CL58_ARUDO
MVGFTRPKLSAVTAHSQICRRESFLPDVQAAGSQVDVQPAPRAPLPARPPPAAHPPGHDRLAEKHDLATLSFLAIVRHHHVPMKKK